MKVVILAGGKGTRISEESVSKPKPMIEIGDKPILWHIMKIYSSFGYNDFIICCGYKGYVIKEYFADYYLHMSDVTFDFREQNRMQIHNNDAEPWRVTLIDTGLDTMTGGRIKRIQKYIPQGESFLMTYGDGVSDIDINKLVTYHTEKKVVATMTIVQPDGRYGAVDVDKISGKVKSFVEKPVGDGGWVNGGFFVLDYRIFDYLDEDAMVFEKEPLEKLVNISGLAAYKHYGYWQSMDSLRDRNVLEEIWKKGKAPWKRW
ncbi:MAG: glucose-1-phosphate cytidylyltransferase [Lachnospiraceae bacterium]|nr:glucose-1-phosphate cytidylyltransferase [Lachnospiraceae bacterium]